MKTKYFVCLPLVILLASCAQDTRTGDVYRQGDTRQAQSVSFGKVTSVRRVKIEGNHEAGTLVGALAGGLLGSQLGRGSAAHTAGAVGGAVAGGVIGSNVEQSMGNRPGVEITVRLNEGGSLSVVQQANPNESFYVGDRVRVLTSGNGGTRVTH